MNIFKRTLATLATLLLLIAPAAFAQTAVNTTTTAAAIGLGDTTIVLASVTNVTGATGIQAGTGIFVDKEMMQAVSVNTASKTVSVTRGVNGTGAAAHANGATAYLGPSSGVTGSPFVFSDPPFGTCSSTAETYSMRINVKSGQLWQCTNSQWLNVQDTFIFLPASSCQSSVSGNSSGTNGYTSVGTAPSLPVVQASTSSTGTNNHYFVCTLNPPPSRLDLSRTVYVVDAEFYYGIQTTGLGTQVSVLASGTMNGTAVFQSTTYPVPAASETATGYTQLARADSGTLTITPVVGSFNVGTTTAGQFFSVDFLPANPIPINTNHGQLLLFVNLLNTATSATITNSPGVLVHYRTLTGF